jgi:hypothetical protein
LLGRAEVPVLRWEREAIRDILLFIHVIDSLTHQRSKTEAKPIDVDSVDPMNKKGIEHEHEYLDAEYAYEA